MLERKAKDKLRMRKKNPIKSFKLKKLEEKLKEDYGKK